MRHETEPIHWTWELPESKVSAGQLASWCFLRPDAHCLMPEHATLQCTCCPSDGAARLAPSSYLGMHVLWQLGEGRGRCGIDFCFGDLGISVRGKDVHGRMVFGREPTMGKVPKCLNM